MGTVSRAEVDPAWRLQTGQHYNQVKPQTYNFKDQEERGKIIPTIFWSANQLTNDVQESEVRLPNNNEK